MVVRVLARRRGLVHARLLAATRLMVGAVGEASYGVAGTVDSIAAAGTASCAALAHTTVRWDITPHECAVAPRTMRESTGFWWCPLNAVGCHGGSQDVSAAHTWSRLRSREARWRSRVSTGTPRCASIM